MKYSYFSNNDNIERQFDNHNEYDFTCHHLIDNILFHLLSYINHLNNFLDPKS
jgi:hypothetical protein